MVIAVYSPMSGFFIGCEPAGFGGVEGAPEFDQHPMKALNLAQGRNINDSEFDSCRYHLGYIRPTAPDAFLMRGRRKDLRDLAAIYQVMET